MAELERLRARDARLTALEQLLEGAFYLTLNANDVFAWACAESCTFSIDEGLETLLEAYQRWGTWGELAFMAECKQCEPQAPLFRKMTPEVRAQYDAARAWVRGKPTGYED